MNQTHITPVTAVKATCTCILCTDSRVLHEVGAGTYTAVGWVQVELAVGREWVVFGVVRVEKFFARVTEC